ncbi:MAG: MinD/ParA family protein [Desulfobacterales bacterium]|jgi:flagellar biosynthesis protein FlhG|nr:MinD/ParA family protein [Desulfobacterales bacterium]
MARIITVTSGKGGVGKTNISVNLAVQLAREGHRPCVFDADLGLANINILLGIRPEFDLEDVINGEKHLSDIIIQDSSGIAIIPGGTGVEKLTGLQGDPLSRLIASFSCLEGYDILIFDTSAGISREVLSFCMAAEEVLLVIIPEPTSLTDGYSLLKVLSLNGYRNPVKVVINQAKHERFAQTIFEKFRETVRKYLPLDILYIGSLPLDEGVAEAVARQRPFVTLYPNGRAAGAIGRLAQNLLDDRPNAAAADEGLNTFWHKYSQIAQGPLRMPHQKPAKPSEAPLAPPPAEKAAVNNESPGIIPLEVSAISQQILFSLNRLVTATTDISRELGEFRQFLGKPTDRQAADDTPPGGPAESQLPPVIALDFEAYVARKQNRAKGES